MALTEKQKAFCREYVRNVGNGTQAYLTAFDSNSETSAAIEASRLLKRDEIQKYLADLNAPLNKKAISEREKKRTWLWNMINNSDTKDSDRLTAMNILNKMDSEYININQNIETQETAIEQLDTTTLKALTGS